MTTNLGFATMKRSRVQEVQDIEQCTEKLCDTRANRDSQRMRAVYGEETLQRQSTSHNSLINTYDIRPSAIIRILVCLQ